MVDTNAKERFEQTRHAIPRLNEVKFLIMNNGDDWKPESVHAKHETSDPTANRAIYAVDELAEKLDALKREESELENLIGESLAIIAAVRRGFGEVYADLLEWRYIDGITWTEIGERRKDMTRQRGNYLLDVCFDWVDSMGVSRLLRGDTEI